MSTTTSNDRISHLPNALLHQILSLLDMKQVVQTSILSKRWKSLWKSVPNIDIHQDLWINRNSDNSEEYDKCKNFVDQVLQHRDDSFHVHKFSLCCVCTNHELVDKWITCAVTQHHVEEFLLERVHLKFSTFLGHVKILSLKSVFLTSQYTCVFDLPVVENFVLYAPRFNPGIAIIINAPCLKHLSVSDYQGVYGSQGIKICAPNLAHLRLKGKSYADYKMGNLNSLETAEIDLRFDHEQVFVMCLGKLLKELRSIKSLTISVRCFQEFPNALKQVPISFCNVKYLKLTTWHPNGPISPMTELLESFPNVETLVLKSAKVSYDLGRDGDGRAQLSFQFRLCHLKTIEIHNIEGCEHELKFLEFLVEHAIVLENISMKSTKILSGDKEIDLINFCKKIQLSVNASLGITICLTVKRETGLTTVFEEFTRSSISPLGKSEHV